MTTDPTSVSRISPGHPAPPSSPTGGPTVGVDLGGSGFRVVLVEGHGRVAAWRAVRWPTAGSPPSPAEALTELARTVRQLGGPDDARVGLAVPGTLDPAVGRVVRAANLGWEDVPLGDLATRALGVDVRVVHDAWAAAEAERRAGAAPADLRTLVVPIGTGISAALVAGDRVVPDLAGELGHLDVGTGLPCPCGATGCLETVASAASLSRRWRARSGHPAADAGAREVVDALRAGDGHAGAVWADAVEGLTTALVAVTRILGPDRVVLAGGLAGAGPVLAVPVAAGLAGRTGFQPAPGVESSSLGPLAGALGAASWAGATTPGPAGVTGDGGSGDPAVVPC
jgi:glucokinase